MKNDGLTKIASLKKQSFAAFQLPGTVNQTPFSLLFLTYDCLNNQPLIHLLSEWRKKHESWFQIQFPIDDQRTKNWLQQRVLDVPDRILFILEIENTYVGHVGLFRYDPTNHTIDIDNIVRGEAGYKGLMQKALEVLMQWGIKELGIKTYTLQTTSDNHKALALYGRLGFTETKRIPMIYTKTEEGGEWIKAEDSKDIKRYEVFMKKEAMNETK